MQTVNARGPGFHDKITAEGVLLVFAATMIAGGVYLWAYGDTHFVLRVDKDALVVAYGLAAGEYVLLSRAERDYELAWMQECWIRQEVK